MGQILVLEYGQPQQRLMGWLLRDSGLQVNHARTLEEALDTLSTEPIRAVVINSRESVAELAPVVETLQSAEADARIVVLHNGGHAEEEPQLDADVCIHDPDDPDRLVEAIRAAAEDQIPNIEPHAAAEQID